jgi:hypothetical protein
MGLRSERCRDMVLGGAPSFVIWFEENGTGVVATETEAILWFGHIGPGSYLTPSTPLLYVRHSTAAMNVVQFRPADRRFHSLECNIHYPSDDWGVNSWVNVVSFRSHRDTHA